MRILCLGDIVGRPGRQAVHELLPGIVRDHRIDLVIANGENIAAGSGITANLFRKLRSYGVDCVTLGDHAFRKSDIFPVLDSSDRLVRPANLSPQAAGRGHVVFPVAVGEREVRVAVMVLAGRLFMHNMPADNPFVVAERVLRMLPETVRVVIVDMHAETTSEKVAMGWHLAGRASVVFGTHTHTPTADARVLPPGTAYVTDVGMCGPYDSVLGRDKQAVLGWMTHSIPAPFGVATGDVRLCGLVAEVDEATGRAVSAERLEVAAGSAAGAYDSDDRSSWSESGED